VQIESVNPILITLRATSRVHGHSSGRRRLEPVRSITIPSRVFVGNLSYETSKEDLETAFSRVGPVTDVVLPVDRATDRPRGFAFVEFGDPGLVMAAIEQLDGTELGGRPLRVSEARERAPRPSFGGGGDWGDRRDTGGGGAEGRPGWGPDRPPKTSRPKGSRRGARGRKRGF
jgi:RNA recognition motif-containing protein